MINLLRAETRRAMHRRVFKLLIAIGVLLAALVAFVLFINTESPDKRQLSAAEVASAVQRCVEQPLPQLPPGFADQMVTTEDPAQKQSRCEEQVAAEQKPRTFDLMSLWERNSRSSPLPTLMSLCTFLAFFLGTSLIGAEWRAGTMTTTLLWEARRVRLAAAKLIAACIASAIATILLTVVFVLLIYPSAAYHGSTELTGDWLRTTAAGYGMALLVVAFNALLGASLAFITRNTAGALGFGFVYSVVFENFMRAWKPAYEFWFLGPNIDTVLYGSLAEGGTPVEYALIRTLAYVGFTVLVAVALFWRRYIASTT